MVETGKNKLDRDEDDHEEKETKDVPPEKRIA